MKQKVVLVIIAIVGLGVGLAIGIIITNTKSKMAIANLQQSEASSQEKIRNCDNTVTRLTGALQLAKIEIETLKNPAPAAEGAAAATAGEKTAAAPDGNAIPTDTKLYTIKSGDSLWSIAQNQLGNSNRLKEILKLNPNISAKSNLAIGAKLKIPVK
jgi:nucleoid-associated protein YgaU